MSTEIRVRGERLIRPGCIEDFKHLAAQAMRRHRELDGPGTLSFDTFIDERQGIWVALEHYADSEAMLDHFRIRSPEISRQLDALSRIGRTEVFGRPSGKLASLLAALGEGVTVFAPLEGIRNEPD